MAPHLHTGARMTKNVWASAPQGRRVVLAALLSIAVGCVAAEESEDEWVPLDSVTIANGIYGQTIAACPVLGTPCTLSAEAGVAVAAYAGTALPSPQDSLPVAITISDDRGFYELALATGTYRVCRGYYAPDQGFTPSSCSGAPWWVDGPSHVDVF